MKLLVALFLALAATAAVTVVVRLGGKSTEQAPHPALPTSATDSSRRIVSSPTFGAQPEGTPSPSLRQVPGTGSPRTFTPARPETGRPNRPVATSRSVGGVHTILLEAFTPPAPGAVVDLRLSVTLGMAVSDGRIELFFPRLTGSPNWPEPVVLVAPPKRVSQLKAHETISYDFQLRLPDSPAAARYIVGIAFVEDMPSGRLSTTAELTLAVGSPSPVILPPEPVIFRDSEGRIIEGPAPIPR